MSDIADLSENPIRGKSHSFESQISGNIGVIFPRSDFRANQLYSTWVLNIISYLDHREVLSGEKHPYLNLKDPDFSEIPLFAQSFSPGFGKTTVPNYANRRRTPMSNGAVSRKSDRKRLLQFPSDQRRYWSLCGYITTHCPQRAKHTSPFNPYDLRSYTGTDISQIGSTTNSLSSTKHIHEL